MSKERDKILTDIGIILTCDERSKAYLQKIIDNGFDLKEIILMDDGRSEPKYSLEEIKESKKCNFDISQSVKDILKNSNLSYSTFNFVDINHPELINHLKKSKTQFFIFTGGGILKKEVLNAGPRFIHFHPGIVPEYKGSTCFYYSIINEGKCGVTAYIMEEGLDVGPIVYQKFFEKPNHIFVDSVYDAHIRSETVIEILKNNLLNEKDWKKQKPNDGENYFIIHPALKHIAILSCVK